MLRRVRNIRRLLVGIGWTTVLALLSSQCAAEHVLRLTRGRHDSTQDLLLPRVINHVARRVLNCGCSVTTRGVASVIAITIVAIASCVVLIILLLRADDASVIDQRLVLLRHVVHIYGALVAECKACSLAAELSAVLISEQHLLLVFHLLSILQININDGALNV